MTSRGRLPSACSRSAAWLAIAALALSGCGSPRRQEDPRLGPDLQLGNVAAVGGSDVFRAELSDQGGFSSYGRTRNILFIDPSGAGRWLVPDNDHVVVEHPIARTSSSMAEEERPVAIAALVRPVSGGAEEAALFILDPTGRTVHKVADNVSEVLGVTLSDKQEPSILYEHEQQYVLVTFARDGLAKIRDTVVSVPELK